MVHCLCLHLLRSWLVSWPTDIYPIPKHSNFPYLSHFLCLFLSTHLLFLSNINLPTLSSHSTYQASFLTQGLLSIRSRKNKAETRGQMGGEKKLFTLNDVAAHSSREDCWLLIHKKAYDVTQFLEDHPGGDEVLLSSTGKDATDDFEDTGHSQSARDLMEKYYIGDVDPATIPTKKTYTQPKQPHYNQDKTSEFVIKLLQYLVPLVILGLAFALRFFTKSSPLPQN